MILYIDYLRMYPEKSGIVQSGKNWIEAHDQSDPAGYVPDVSFILSLTYTVFKLVGNESMR